jgi:hypothetical protein
MKRWNTKQKKHAESPAVDAFLAEVIEVCRKHGLSISHEDTGGSFEVRQFNQRDSDWLLSANDDRKH